MYLNQTNTHISNLNAAVLNVKSDNVEYPCSISIPTLWLADVY
jgi:hypothetical protein